jgi:hypothetical protein
MISVHVLSSQLKYSGLSKFLFSSIGCFLPYGKLSGINISNLYHNFLHAFASEHHELQDVISTIVFQSHGVINFNDSANAKCTIRYLA